MRTAISNASTAAITTAAIGENGWITAANAPKYTALEMIADAKNASTPSKEDRGSDHKRDQRVQRAVAQPDARADGEVGEVGGAAQRRRRDNSGLASTTAARVDRRV
ncbi:hypothetical protein ACWDKQ_17590 [Saccharopolyspora sp. NPDC000995]